MSSGSHPVQGSSNPTSSAGDAAASAAAQIGGLSLGKAKKNRQGKSKKPNWIANGRQILDKLPLDISFKEPMGGAYLPSEETGYNFELLHKEYRGKDRPTIFQIPKGSGRKSIYSRKVEDAKHAIVFVRTFAGDEATFGDMEFLARDPKENLEKGNSKAVRLSQEEGDMDVDHEDLEEGGIDEDMGEAPATTGGSDPTTAQSTSSARIVQVSYGLDTQHPSIVLEMGDKENPIFYTLFANNLHANSTLTESGLGVDFYSQQAGDDEEIKVNLPENNTRLQDMFNERALRETRIQVTYETEPKFAGVDEKRLDTLKCSSLSDPMNNTDTLLAYLANAESISIYTLWRYEWNISKAPLQHFVDFFTAATKLCQEHGYWWYYRLEYLKLKRKEDPNIEIDTRTCLKDVDIYLEKISPPRWLCSTWEADVKDGTVQVETIAPVGWGEFNLLRQYPDTESKAFLDRLALRREKQWERRRILTMTETVKGKQLMADVISSHRVPGMYVFSIKIARSDDSGGERSAPMPEISTRVEVRVNKSDGSFTEF
jgi:hypothetical protein